MEIVRTRDGQAIELGPCPRWCTGEHLFGPVEITHASDGYHHCGRVVRIEIPNTVEPGVDPVVVEIGLESWTCPLNAGPGPARISVNFVSGDDGMDLTPADARRLAKVLIGFADGMAVETNG